MARPFFSGNYGSSLGNFSQAANLIAQAGQIQGQARAQAGAQMGQIFAGLGKIAGESIAKFDEEKKKKREEKQNASMIGGFLKSNRQFASQLGVKPTDEITFEEAADKAALGIAKNEKGMEFVQNLMQMNQQAAAARQQKQLFDLQMLREKQKQGMNQFLAQPGPSRIDPAGPDRRSVLRNLRAGKGVTPPARMISGPSAAEESVMSPQAKEFVRRAITANQPMSQILPMAQQIDANVSSQVSAGQKSIDSLQEKENKLRSEFNNLAPVKEFDKVRTAYDKVKLAGQNPSAAGDLSLIFNYMKILDPGSVVREGEFANAQNAAGVDDRIRNKYNQIIEGTRLNEKQRADFLNQSKLAASAQFKPVGEAMLRYQNIALTNNLRLGQILPQNFLQLADEFKIEPPTNPQKPLNNIVTDQGSFTLPPGLQVIPQ